LFRACSFEVLDLRLEYSGQYLTLVARPTEGASPEVSELEESAADIIQATRDFSTRFLRLKELWERRLREHRLAGRRVVLWGSGSKALAFILAVEEACSIEFVVDINPHKHGKFMPGAPQQIVGPDSLTIRPPDVVVVMNPVYLEEIRGQLAGMGLHPELMAL
jgi:hypothetical protein